MVWPIIRGKSYVGEAFKSMKAVGTAAAQKDGWRYIAITLIEGVLSVMACFQQLCRNSAIIAVREVSRFAEGNAYPSPPASVRRSSLAPAWNTRDLQKVEHVNRQL